MKKIFFALFGVWTMSVANAAVVERTDCGATQSEINELKSVVEPDDETKQRLAELEVIYRRDCTKRATGRRTSGHVIKTTSSEEGGVVAIDEAEEIIEAEPVAVVEVEVLVPDTVGVVTPPAEPTAEEVEANEQAGLCPNGDAPNRFGCCAGEKFMELENMVFACCPDGGGDCFPPLK